MSIPAKQTETSRTVELTIAARAENLAIARLAVAGAAAIAGASPDAIADLKLAVTEACTNAIQHAYGDGPGEVVVRCEMGDGVLSVEIEDRGAGFEPADVRPAAVEHDGKSRGLGLSIIRMLSDELTIDSSGSGTRITIVKRLSPA